MNREYQTKLQAQAADNEEELTEHIPMSLAALDADAVGPAVQGEEKELLLLAIVFHLWFVTPPFAICGKHISVMYHSSNKMV